MSNFIVGQLKPRTDEEYQAAIDEMLAEVQQSQAPIDRHQERTERLKAETQKRGNAETQKLKMETDLIHAQTQVYLGALAKWVRPDVG